MSIASEVHGRVQRTGLLEPGVRLLALVSGGADSTCLVHVVAELLGRDAVQALYVDHGLRPAAREDERFCASLCRTLGVGFHVERLRLPGRGNTEALAREGRYEAAERLRSQLELDRVATGHTATDQVETVLFRLVSSPGRRAILGMSPRSGTIVRPLLEVSREETHRYCEAVGLSWREDESNLDLAFARNRLRLEVLPALRQIHPAADRNVLATADQLREEAGLLETAVDRSVEELAAGGRAPAVDGARLRELQPALRRLVLRRLAEEAAGDPVPLRARQVDEIERLVEGGGSASLDLGRGLRVVSEYGVLRFQRAVDASAPEPTPLPVPGRCRFGDWEVVCEVESEIARAGLGSLDEALLDAAKLGGELTVRSWREGDRMAPLGLAGTKSLQDLFTDRKVPRSLRRALPVVESEGEIAWVAGVAVSDLFKIGSETTRAARLRASHAEG